MQTKKWILVSGLLWLILPTDACAWGLYSHVAYTHAMLNALPWLPAPLLQAVQRFPSLVLAGACLPDLAVVSRRFKQSHGWGLGQQLLHDKDEALLALGIGYNSHLLADVVAHQHFVPSFEAKWNSQSILTHAFAEWAMDAHLQRPEVPMPSTLLLAEQKNIVALLSPVLGIEANILHGAIDRLARADQALRFSRIPQTLLKRYCKRDSEFVTKLDYYQAQVTLTLNELPQVLAGAFPSLHAEHVHLGMDQLDDWRSKCLQDARLRPTRAIVVFEHYQHQWSKQPDC